MKLFIPRVGDKIKLNENWNCSIESEYRNDKIFDALGIQRDNSVQGTAISISMPKDTVLRVDRLYVRAPASQYDSITFTVESSPLPGIEKARFWVKVTEANQMECERYFPSREQAKKFNELFNLVANELDISDTQHMDADSNAQILDSIVANEPSYQLTMKIPRVAIEHHIANHWSESRWNRDKQRSQKQDEELKKIQEYFNQHQVPQYIELNVEVRRSLEALVYRNTDAKYFQLVSEYNAQHEPPRSYWHKLDWAFDNDDWKHILAAKESLRGFYHFSPNNFILPKEHTPAQAFEDWKPTLSAPDGTAVEVRSLEEVFTNIVKWQKPSKAKKSKAKP